MFYIDSTQEKFDIYLTLGARDTMNPPPLAMGFIRAGTNESVSLPVNAVVDNVWDDDDIWDDDDTWWDTIADGYIIPGTQWITIRDIKTEFFKGTGQYHYIIFDNTDPEARVVIEVGLCIVTADPITKKQYGTDKERGEYKGHL